MIPAVSQTLARIIASQTSLDTVQQVSFDLPRRIWSQPTRVNLYVYDVRPKTCEFNHSVGSESDETISDWIEPPGWHQQVEILFLIVARDWTRLGEQQLLSEVITYFARHSEIPEDGLVPALRGYGGMAIEIAQPMDVVALWQALEVPLQPALYLKVTVPLRELSVCEQPDVLKTL